MMMRLKIGKILLLCVFSCLLAAPLLASDPVTIVIEETTIEQKTKLFVYGYAEGVDRRQEVSITLSDPDAKTLELKAETNKIGNWSVEDIDIGALSDGEIAITAAITDETGKPLARTNSVAVLDTSLYAKPVLLPLGLNAAVDVIAGEVGEEVIVHHPPVRDLEGHSQPVDRVIGAIDGRQRSVGEPLLDAVFAQSLSGLEHAGRPAPAPGLGPVHTTRDAAPRVV